MVKNKSLPNVSISDIGVGYNAKIDVYTKLMSSMNKLDDISQ